jgi:MbtH protein
MRDDIPYRVLVNDEDQHSVWPAHLDIPAGWRAEGHTGTQDECAAHVDTVWTDMRPRSLRDHMDATG